MRKDYYVILEVSRDVSEEELKRAYRKLALQYHPDRNPGDRDAEERFKEISEAYEVLSNPEKRMRYERFGTVDDMSVFDFGFDGGGFDNIFNNLFTDFFGGTRQRAQKGDDLRYNLEIEFEEAIFGTEREIQIPKIEKCPVCKGTRAEPGYQPSTCRHCGGRGQVRQTHGFFTINRTCEYCNGEGQIIKNPCKTCKGKGQVKTKKDLKIRIPAGVDTGSRLKVRGEGIHGYGDTVPGDLYVVIKVRDHHIFERNGDDIVIQVDVSFPLLCLGGDIPIPTVEGETVLTIPPGTQPGKVFRLKQQGVQRSNGYGRGDQLVYLNLMVPEKLNTKQKTLMEELAKELNVDVGTARKGFKEKFKEFFTE